MPADPLQCAGTRRTGIAPWLPLYHPSRKAVPERWQTEGRCCLLRLQCSGQRAANPPRGQLDPSPEDTLPYPRPAQPVRARERMSTAGGKSCRPGTGRSPAHLSSPPFHRQFSTADQRKERRGNAPFQVHRCLSTLWKAQRQACPINLQLPAPSFAHPAYRLFPAVRFLRNQAWSSSSSKWQ